MVADPATILAKTNGARLPKVYENAKGALAKCSEIDECVDWSDRSEALRSYAKQSKDEELEKFCVRIKARAIRRCGELLKEIDGRPDNAKKQKDGDGLLISQKRAAADAGLSERQQKTAVRVASIPENSFERQIDSDDPPTVTALAEHGKKVRPPLIDLRGIQPDDFAESTQLQGNLTFFIDFCREVDWKAAARGAFPEERKKIRDNARTIIGLMERLLKELETK